MRRLGRHTAGTESAPGTLYRGMTVQFYDWFWEELADRHARGATNDWAFVMDYIRKQGFARSDYGFGSHWTRSFDVAKNYAYGSPGAGLPVVLRAEWNGQGLDTRPAFGGGITDSWAHEQEVTLLEDAPLTLTGIWWKVGLEEIPMPGPYATTAALRTASAGRLYRGVRVQLDQALLDTLADPIEVTDVGRELEIGPIVLDQLSAYGGLGTHWSTRPEIAERFALDSSSQATWGVGVLLTADWNGQGEDPDRIGVGGIWADEAEVTLLPGTPLTIVSVVIGSSYRDGVEVLHTTKYQGHAHAFAEHGLTVPTGGPQTRTAAHYVEHHEYTRDPQSGAGNCWCGHSAESVMHEATRTAQDYFMDHRPAGPEYGAPLHDVTTMFGDFFYQQPQSYNHGEDGADEAIRVMVAARGKPDASITIYRAVPPGTPPGFRTGDWVTTARAYADQHGWNALDGEYEILVGQARAQDLWTEGNSVCEWGYHGSPVSARTAAIEDHRPGWDPEVKALLNRLREISDETTRPGSNRQRNAEARAIIETLRAKGFDSSLMATAGVRTAKGFPKNQKCEYCKEQATQRIIHSEGMAYVPVCDSHLSKGKDDAAACVPYGEPDPSNIDRVEKISAYYTEDELRALGEQAMAKDPRLRELAERWEARQADIGIDDIMDLLGPSIRPAEPWVAPERPQFDPIPGVEEGWEEYALDLLGRPDYTHEADLWLPTEVAWYYREYDRSGNSGQASAVEYALRQEGIRSPVTISTDGRSALLIEGNHRVMLARRLGIASIPVRIQWDPNGVRANEGTPKPLEPTLADWLRQTGRIARTGLRR